MCWPCQKLQLLKTVQHVLMVQQQQLNVVAQVKNCILQLMERDGLLVDEDHDVDAGTAAAEETPAAADAATDANGSGVPQNKPLN